MVNRACPSEKVTIGDTKLDIPKIRMGKEPLRRSPSTLGVMLKTCSLDVLRNVGRRQRAANFGCEKGRSSAAQTAPVVYVHPHGKGDKDISTNIWNESFFMRQRRCKVAWYRIPVQLDPEMEVST
eukprot:759361-Hanusia_phi.AAC.3